jgi:hypothetical protein
MTLARPTTGEAVTGIGVLRVFAVIVVNESHLRRVLSSYFSITTEAERISASTRTRRIDDRPLRHPSDSSS